MFYYTVNASQTTNAGAGTENQSARLLTVANQRTAFLTSLSVSSRMAAAGGLIMRVKVAATPGTVGAAYTPDKCDPDAPAAGTTAFTAHTVGTTLTTRRIVGCAAPGGFGGWFAAAMEQALAMKPNGGASGNAELTNICGLASTTFDWALELAEA